MTIYSHCRRGTILDVPPLRKNIVITLANKIMLVSRRFGNNIKINITYMRINFSRRVSHANFFINRVRNAINTVYEYIKINKI